MKRILYFFSGIILLTFMTYHSIKIFDVPELQSYLVSLESYNAFWYVYYIVIGLLFLMALVFIIMTFRPSHKKRTLSWETHSGTLEIPKKAIESYIIKSIYQFNHVRLEQIQTSLKSRRNRKAIQAKIKVLWLPNHETEEASIEDISDYIKTKLEEFTNANVDEVKIEVVEQANKETSVV